MIIRYRPDGWAPSGPGPITESISGSSGGSSVDTGVISGAGPSLTRGAGANIPDGGVGWSLWMELDVTDPDQSGLKSDLSYLASSSFVGARWTTPDGDGSGAYWDQTVDGRRCMEFRWGAGGSSEGRCALAEFTSGTEYDQMYQRAIVRFSPQEHWPSDSIKLLRTLRDTGGSFANGFFNAGSNNSNPNFPIYWAFTNIGTGNGGVEYRSSQNYTPDSEDVWFEIEVLTIKNSASAFDGSGKGFVGNVGATVQIDDFDQLGGSSPILDTDNPSDMSWSSQGRGHGFYDMGPYLGGSPGIILSTDQSIFFACHSIWVK